MKVRWFITHKKSETYSDCCDRFSCNAANRRMAISDGISQSVFSGEWAEILTEGYVKGLNLGDESERVHLCEMWLERVQSYVAEKKKTGVSTWRLERHLTEKNGAGATFCGIEFKNRSDWDGFVLGDSCLIEVENECGSYKINIHSSNVDGVFDNCPDYFDSFESNNGKGHPKQLCGKISDRSFLLLVTDPFASFLSRNKDNITQYIEQILALVDHKGFCHLVDKWRTNGMTDDDSTLGIIEYDGEDNETELHRDDLHKLIEKGDRGLLIKIGQTISKYRGQRRMNGNLRQRIERRTLNVNFNARKRRNIKKHTTARKH